MAAAASGAQALQRAAEEATDLAVLDVAMPGMDGLEAAARLRARDPGCAILILSARGAAGDLRRAYDAGADDYVIKPFTGADLTRRAAAAMRSRRASA